MNNVCRQSIRHALTSIALGLALSGCGGSGTAANLPPVITSGATASVVENSTGVAYQATATDPENNAVSFSISGADASLFTINSAGEIRFVSPPNFERPGDTQGKNAYSFQLTASDGSSSTSQAITITVTNSKEGISVERISTGLFNHPVSIVAIPGQSQLMVAERSGAIFIYDPATKSRTSFATIEGLTTASGQGVFSVAVSPNFATQHSIYVLYARGSSVAIRQIYVFNGQSGYAEFTIGNHGAYSNDIGGWLGFGSNGLLYAATGDAGGTSDPSGSAQSDSSLFGKLLSFSQLNFDIYGGASVQPPIVPSIVAKGLHFPIGGSFASNSIFLPDRGQSQREEVDLVSLANANGDNLGWPYREGTVMNVTGEPAGLLPPVLEYPHGTGTYEGQQIAGGIVFQGSNQSLSGRYVFFDITGAVFTIPVSSLQRGTTIANAMFERRDLDFTPDSGTIAQPVSVVQDAAGFIYIACDDGDIFRVTAS